MSTVAPRHVLVAGLALAGAWGASGLLLESNGSAPSMAPTLAPGVAASAEPLPAERRAPSQPGAARPDEDPLGALEDDRLPLAARLEALARAVERPEPAAASIRLLLASPRTEPALRLALVRALALPGQARREDPETVSLLCRLLEEAADPELALAVGDALEARAALPIAPLLRPLERAIGAEARVAAARAVSGALPTQAAWDALSRRLEEDPSPQVRGEVLGLLAQLDRERAEPLAIGALAKDPELLDAATRVLARAGPEGERRLIAGFLTADARSAACRAHARALAVRAPGHLLDAALGVTDRAEIAVEALERAGALRALADVGARGAREEARAAARLALARIRPAAPQGEQK